MIAPVVELAQVAMMVVAQAKNSSNTVQQSLAVVTAEEQARTAAVAIAQAASNTARFEREKAIFVMITAQEAAKPPVFPQRGFAAEPLQVTYDRWLANKTSAAAAAAEQFKIAANALEQAKSAASFAVMQSQVVADAVKQAQLDIEAATQAQAAAKTIIQAASLASAFTPEMDAHDSQTADLQENASFSVWLESVGIRERASGAFSLDSAESSYPKFTQDKDGLVLRDEVDLAWDSIESYFKDRNTQVAAGPFANYASMLASCKPAGPFCEIPFLGYVDQSTVHFHCGIGNSFASVVEGGLCLNKTLDRRFAVQPHLIHSNNVAKGLLFVLFENTKEQLQQLKAAGVSVNSSTIAGLPELTLECSQIQESIAYEVENLAKIAQNIIATGKSNLKQVHVTFSNGGYVFREALKQLAPEYRGTIIVIPAGTTAIIENNLAHKVYNVIGDKDWPSISCNGGMDKIEAAKQSGATIEIIPQTEEQPRIGGHYFMQPNYQDAISEFIEDEITADYEIY